MSNPMATAGAVAVGAVAAYAGLKLVRGKLYDFVIVKMTTEWYREVLDVLAPGSRVLDVGIGTGMALLNNKPLLVKKKLVVDGVDYDADYVVDCKKNIQQHGLDDAVHVVQNSIYDYTSTEKYDAVYFSGSLMIMPDPVQALSHTASLLQSNGRIYVTQTIQTRKSFALEVGKPLLKFITTIDFGHVTYEPELLDAIQKAGLRVLVNKPISGSSLDSVQSYRLLVLEKAP